MALSDVSLWARLTTMSTGRAAGWNCMCWRMWVYAHIFNSSKWKRELLHSLMGGFTLGRDQLSHWAGNNNFHSFSARYCSADNKEQVWIFPEQLSAKLRRTRAKIYEIKWMHFLEHINTSSSCLRPSDLSRCRIITHAVQQIVTISSKFPLKVIRWEFSSKVQSTRRREPRNFAASIVFAFEPKNDYN